MTDYSTWISVKQEPVCDGWYPVLYKGCTHTGLSYFSKIDGGWDDENIAYYFVLPSIPKEHQ